MNAGLQDSTYIMAQVAIAFHNMRQVSLLQNKRLENIATAICRVFKYEGT